MKIKIKQVYEVNVNDEIEIPKGKSWEDVAYFKIHKGHVMFQFKDQTFGYVDTTEPPEADNALVLNRYPAATQILDDKDNTIIDILAGEFDVENNRVPEYVLKHRSRSVYLQFSCADCGKLVRMTNEEEIFSLANTQECAEAQQFFCDDCINGG